jgi:ribosomal protein S18 acetylase RimI-like enzyme
MDIEIRQIKKNDSNAARKFAIEGMHLNWYASNRFELYIYSKYFCYLEISKATKALGAYMGNNMVGILLADIKNEQKIYKSIWYKIFVKTISFFMNILYKNASNTYDETNERMLNEFKKENNPDGEINFFAVDPNFKGKGIGTLLLNELEKQEKGKLIYLFTDNGSTYQFYYRRGFRESGKTDIKLKINTKETDLTCFLFSKIL